MNGGKVRPAGDVLRELWPGLRDDGGREAQAYFTGAVAMAYELGALDIDRRAVGTPHGHPGHSDEGGRDWCAYCGHMPAGTEVDGGRMG